MREQKFADPGAESVAFCQCRHCLPGIPSPFSVPSEGVAAHAKFTRIARVYKVPSGAALSAASLASWATTAEKLFRAVAARMVCSVFGHVKRLLRRNFGGAIDRIERRSSEWSRGFGAIGA